MTGKLESQYNEKADPKDFAPDFSEKKEPYGDPVQEILSLLKEELALPSSIIDIAGGYGRYAMPLLNEGHKVTIVDIHDASLEEATNRAANIPSGLQNLHLSNKDVLRDDITEYAGNYDAAICIGFLHHLTPKGGEMVIESMIQMLRPGGLLMVEFSCDKDRRLPNGEKILVEGDDEQNLSLNQGMAYLNDIAHQYNLEYVKMPVKKLVIRDDDFWYDTNMIMFHARKVK